MSFFNKILHKKEPKKKTSQSPNNDKLLKIRQTEYPNLLAMLKAGVSPDPKADVTIEAVHYMEDHRFSPNASIQIIMGDNINISMDLRKVITNSNFVNPASKRQTDLANQIKSKAKLVAKLTAQGQTQNAEMEKHRLQELYIDLIKISKDEQDIQIHNFEKKIKAEQELVATAKAHHQADEAHKHQQILDETVRQLKALKIFIQPDSQKSQTTVFQGPNKKELHAIAESAGVNYLNQLPVDKQATKQESTTTQQQSAPTTEGGNSMNENHSQSSGTTSTTTGDETLSKQETRTTQETSSSSSQSMSQKTPSTAKQSASTTSDAPKMSQSAVTPTPENRVASKRPETMDNPSPIKNMDQCQDKVGKPIPSQSGSQTSLTKGDTTRSYSQNINYNPPASNSAGPNIDTQQIKTVMTEAFQKVKDAQLNYNDASYLRIAEVYRQVSQLETQTQEEFDAEVMKRLSPQDAKVYQTCIKNLDTLSEDDRQQLFGLLDQTQLGDAIVGASQKQVNDKPVLVHHELHVDSEKQPSTQQESQTQNNAVQDQMPTDTLESETPLVNNDEGSVETPLFKKLTPSLDETSDQNRTVSNNTEQLSSNTDNPHQNENSNQINDKREQLTEQSNIQNNNENETIPVHNAVNDAPMENDNDTQSHEVIITIQDPDAMDATLTQKITINDTMLNRFNTIRMMPNAIVFIKKNGQTLAFINQTKQAEVKLSGNPVKYFCTDWEKMVPQFKLLLTAMPNVSEDDFLPNRFIIN